MEAMVILPISCFHHMAVDRISGPPESNNSKRGLQGHGFGGFEGGGGYPRLSEWSQMEAMVILPISYLHDIAVKCLVFLTYTPSNSSALCAMVTVQQKVKPAFTNDQPRGVTHLKIQLICTNSQFEC